jgi:hypothetical protein
MGFMCVFMVYKNSALVRHCTRHPYPTVQNSSLPGAFRCMLRFEALYVPKPGAKKGAPTRAKMGHPGRATAKVEVLRSGFWPIFCAIENTPKKWPFLRQLQFYHLGCTHRNNFSRNATRFWASHYGVMIFLRSRSLLLAFALQCPKAQYGGGGRSILYI